ncbi:ATP-dependent DNA helicase PIF1-like protein [Tanacetum coccineum]
MLLSNSKTLKEIANISYLDSQYNMDGYNMLVYDELKYDKHVLILQHDTLYCSSSAHSRFAIPINLVEDSLCSISVDNDLTELLYMAKLVAWDEAPMVHRHCMEALDRTMCDLMSIPDKVFYGKVVVFGGAFRQILPVIPNDSRQDVVHASIKAFKMWQHCIVLKLTVNMGLRVGFDCEQIEEIKEFADWILDIGDGKVGGFFQEMAILAPTHDEVDKINDRMISLLPGEERVFYSSDTICQLDMDITFDERLYSTDFLNTIKMSGIPRYELSLKVGVYVMYLRNVDQRVVLCNGTRLQVLGMGVINIEARIISRRQIGQICAIPRMLISPSDKKMLFKLNKR